MKSILVLLAFITACHASALREDLSDEEEYDQRQNGSENYRINVDGVVIAIAPAEEVLSAVSNVDLDQLVQLADDSLDSQIHKQPSKPVITLLSSSSSGTKPSNDSQAENKTTDDKSKNRLGQRLISIIKPFLRRSHTSH